MRILEEAFFGEKSTGGKWKNTARGKEKVFLKSFRLKEKVAQGFFYCCCLVAVYN